MVSVTVGQMFAWPMAVYATMTGHPLALLHVVLAATGFVCWASSSVERVPNGGT